MLYKSLSMLINTLNYTPETEALVYGLDLKNALTGQRGGLESIHSTLECLETLWPFKDICFLGGGGVHL